MIFYIYGNVGVNKETLLIEYLFYLSMNSCIYLVKNNVYYRANENKDIIIKLTNKKYKRFSLLKNFGKLNWYHKYSGYNNNMKRESFESILNEKIYLKRK